MVGLLRQLNEREVTAVLAHELNHIVNKDIWVMSLADVITRFTRILALMGYILVLINIPIIMLNNEPLPWLLLFILIITPNKSAIFQLALSRTREYTADTDAVNLTGAGSSKYCFQAIVFPYRHYYVHTRQLKIE